MSHTCLGGTLLRVAHNQWQWSDGSPEPRVSDLSASSHFNFRCSSLGGATFVEVMLSAAHRERDVLGWVIDGAAKGLYPQSLSGDHIGPRVIRLTESYGDGDIPGISTPDVSANMTRQSVTPDGATSKRAIPRVAMVPIAEWDEWAARCPYGATWPKEAEADIFSKARSLGWEG